MIIGFFLTIRLNYKIHEMLSYWPWVRRLFSSLKTVKPLPTLLWLGIV